MHVYNYFALVYFQAFLVQLYSQYRLIPSHIYMYCYFRSGHNYELLF